MRPFNSGARALVCAAFFGMNACQNPPSSQDGGSPDSGPIDAGPIDAGPIDAGPIDAGPIDAGPIDAGPIDAGPVESGPIDSGQVDAGSPDAGRVVDAGSPDAGRVDAGHHDAGPVDGGPVDAGPVDAGPVDAGSVDAGPIDAGPVDAGLEDAGSEDGGMEDGGPLPFPPPPQIQNFYSAGVTQPLLVPIFFPNDDDPSATIADMTAFFQGIGGSQYWQGLAAYGRYGIAAVTPYTMPSPAPATIDDSQVPSLLAQATADGGVHLNPADTPIYVLNFPSTTSVTLHGASSCTDFTGYQTSAFPGFLYVVIPRCPAGGSFTTDLQRFTASASRQLVNAVTAPYHEGWYAVDAAHWYFDEVNGGSRPGDMCIHEPQAYFEFTDFPYTVTRYWLNGQATAGHDPCAPLVPGEVYVNAVPVLPDKGPLDFVPYDDVVSDSVEIQMGQSAPVTLDLYSDAPAGPWSVQVQDGSAILGGPELLSFSLPTSTGSNGDKLTLTITVNGTGDGYTQAFDTELFIVTSTLGTGTTAVSYQWYGLVTSGNLSAPQVLNAGGLVLASPALVPIFFSNDNDPGATVPEMTAFFNGLGASSYWATVSEYGVGPIASVTPVTLAEAAPASVEDNGGIDSALDGGLSQLQTWLDNEIETSAVPANVEGSTLYVLDYPTTTTATLVDNGVSCSYFLGYHNGYQRANGQVVAYAVVPRCTAAEGNDASDLQTFTTTASHELVEASTDPLGTAWSQVDDPHAFWNEATGGGTEIADMCEADPQANYQFPDFPFLMQRIWSNAAAKAGHDPCVPPMTGEIYYKAEPELDSFGEFYDYGFYQVHAVNIPVGETATIPVHLYADGDAGTFTVLPIDYNVLNNAGPPLLSFSISSETGQSGDVVMLTIKVNAAGGHEGQALDTEAFAVLTTQGTGNNVIVHEWWGLVVSAD